MINIPFNRSTFASEMKPLISGNNLTLEYDNLESTLSKVAVDLGKLIGVTLYDKICSKTAASGASAVALNNQAIDYLRRTMLHFAIYHHIIYLIANIENDGITVKKTDDSTTIYKYQQDELKDQLISDAWFWLNQLITLLNANTTSFTDWNGSAAKAAFDSMPVSLSDFEKFVGVGDATFILYAAWIIREVNDECVKSRIQSSTAVSDKMKRAICYEVLARACQRLAYYCLPAPIRLDINNEMGKNHSQAADEMIRGKIADIYVSKAVSYWKAVDDEISHGGAQPVVVTVSATPYKKQGINPDDKFAAL